MRRSRATSHKRPRGTALAPSQHSLAEYVLCSDVGGEIVKSLALDDVLSLARTSSSVRRAMDTFVFSRTKSLGLCLTTPAQSRHTTTSSSSPARMMASLPTVLPLHCKHKRVLHASRLRAPHSLLNGLFFPNVTELTLHVAEADLERWVGHLRRALPNVRDLALRISPTTHHPDQQHQHQHQHQHPPHLHQQHQHQHQHQHHHQLELPPPPPPLQARHRGGGGGPTAAWPVIEAPACLQDLLSGVAGSLRSLSLQGVDQGVLGPSFVTALPNMPKLQRLELCELSSLPARHPLQLALRRVHNVTVLHVCRHEPNPRAFGNHDAAMVFGCGLADGLFDSEIEVVELRVYDAWIPLGEVLREFVTLATLEWLAPGIRGIAQGDDYEFWEPGEDVSQLSVLRLRCIDHATLTPEGAQAMVRMCPHLETLRIEGVPLEIPDVAQAAVIPNTDATGFVLDLTNTTVQTLLALSALKELANLNIAFTWPHEAFSEHRVSLAVATLSHALERVANKTDLSLLSVSLCTRKHAHPANHHAAMLAAAGLQRALAQKNFGLDVSVV